MKRFLHNNNGLEEYPEWEPDCWVNVECPDDDDTHFLREILNVPESFLISVADIDERPRVERENDWLLTILRIPKRSDSPSVPFETVPIGIIIKNDIVVSICHFKTELIDDFIDHAYKREITIGSKSDLILRLIYSSAYWYLRYLKQLNSDVDAIEKELQLSVKNQDLLSLMRQQRSLVYFNTAIRGNQMMIDRLTAIFKDELDEDLLEDVNIELKQAMNTVKVYSDILAGTMDTYASVISNNVNSIMKRMTSVSIALMVPTLIASFYGMNVTISMASNPAAFWFIIIMSALLTAAVCLWFRKIRWF